MHLIWRSRKVLTRNLSCLIIILINTNITNTKNRNGDETLIEICTRIQSTIRLFSYFKSSQVKPFESNIYLKIDRFRNTRTRKDVPINRVTYKYVQTSYIRRCYYAKRDMTVLHKTRSHYYFLDAIFMNILNEIKTGYRNEFHKKRFSFGRNACAPSYCYIIMAFRLLSYMADTILLI